MTWLLYDDGVAGHHLPYLRVIDGELRSRSMSPLIASPVAPPGDPSERWIPIESLAHRDLIGKRRQVRSVVEAGLDKGADTLIDLFFDKTAWAAGSTRPIRRRVYVLHHIDQLSPEARSGLARWRGHLLRRLVRVRSEGGSVVVHTPGAAELMGEVFGESRVFLAGYPVEPMEAEPAPSSNHDRPVLAFAGGAREEKGLATLARAAQLLRHDVEVVVLGPQPDGTREDYEPLLGSVPVTWHDSLLEVSELRGRLASASLVILPYHDRFGRYGGSSASLLDTVAAGAPAVVSPALADQLPAEYGAVVATDGEDPRSLAEAIDVALEDLPRLRQEARRVGPSFIESAHSAAAYVDVLDEAAQASG